LAARGKIHQSEVAKRTRRKRIFVALGIVFLLPVLAHFVVLFSTSITPPQIAPMSGDSTTSADGVRHFEGSYVRKRGNILEVRLMGTPEEIGHRHARLLYPEMVANEVTLQEQFQHFVPIPPLRWLIMDLSRMQFREVDQGMSDIHRREIAAQARAFSPDPFTGLLPTYHRFVFLHSLYDIALSFEHSPLIGCTSFGLSDGAFEQGHVVLARNFDFEAGDIFDTGKAVFLVHEKDSIPYASVAWPGLIGAFSGLNAEGLSLVVHGARARTPQTVGEPVIHTTRDVLAHAKTTAEAIEIIRGRKAMVSHLLMLADASGDIAIVERAPGEPIHVRKGRGKVPLTNHFEGPLAADPANHRVEATTSTRPRRMRLDELLEKLPAGSNVEAVVGILRDKKTVGNVDLPLGHRRTIDAMIATHSVVMDSTARVMWVSEGPHLLGRFIRFDLARLLDPTYEPVEEPLVTVSEDPLYRLPAYETWKQGGEKHQGEN
jgi:isopenicillin-N N-acyltransferase-like protein